MAPPRRLDSHTLYAGYAAWHRHTWIPYARHNTLGTARSARYGTLCTTCTARHHPRGHDTARSAQHELFRTRLFPRLLQLGIPVRFPSGSASWELPGLAPLSPPCRRFGVRGPSAGSHGCLSCVCRGVGVPSPPRCTLTVLHVRLLRLQRSYGGVIGGRQ